ncbi:hypothetical protein MLD38_011499 [Melastoma candidum]|uniref:Uncharacterized protein n=1 Tax=Melastoma candidum TaxID=119954 RepID=A0ACB9R7E0_9MYRT|nr:hypothetical protein MLD38_011499 [Melastoma candidum]
MGNTLRCCLACMLPCGALDVIRVVHLNGHVQEISHPVTAREVLLSKPGHVLTNPCSEDNGLPPRVLVLSPDAELRRGAIYFLIPDEGGTGKGPSPRSSRSDIRSCKSRRQVRGKPSSTTEDEHRMTEQHIRKRRKDRRSRRSRTTAALWRPHLESISED